ncbi:MAG: gliding motility lipoprotein GldB [Methanosarcinaceae archaeon]
MIMMKSHTLPFYLFIALLLLQSCDHGSSRGPEVEGSLLQKTDVKIHRYGKALFEIDTVDFLNGVRKIQNEFSLFLGNNIESPGKLAPLHEYVTDTQLISISKKVMEVYPDLILEEAQLSDAFSRYHYFFPDKKIPVVYSYVSDLHYENPVIVNDTVVIIALDVYLGNDFTKYRSLGLPYYKIRCMTPDNIVIDVMKSLYNHELNTHHKQKTLIDRMVGAGKLLYYLDEMLPGIPDSLKIRYTSNQMEWIEDNKTNVWAFFVKNKLFYSSDYKVQSKLIQDGPFTTGFSNESPPRMGVWLGWKIVREYMYKHPDTSLESLIQNTDAQAIFNQSGYKP